MIESKCWGKALAWDQAWGCCDSQWNRRCSWKTWYQDIRLSWLMNLGPRSGSTDNTTAWKPVSTLPGGLAVSQKPNRPWFIFFSLTWFKNIPFRGSQNIGILVHRILDSAAIGNDRATPLSLTRSLWFVPPPIRFQSTQPTVRARLHQIVGRGNIYREEK